MGRYFQRVSYFDNFLCSINTSLLLHLTCMVNYSQVFIMRLTATGENKIACVVFEQSNEWSITDVYYPLASDKTLTMEYVYIYIYIYIYIIKYPTRRRYNVLHTVNSAMWYLDQRRIAYLIDA